MNINFERNKVSGLTNLIFEHVDILIVAETKLDTSLPTAQFFMPGFHKPFWLDAAANSGGLLLFDKVSIRVRELQAFKLPFDI